MSQSYSFFIVLGAAFILAGFVKGVIGMGLPTVAMGLLGLIMTPVESAAILVIPSVVTNTWQLLAGPNFLHLIRRLWLFLLFVCIGIWSGFGLMSPDNADFAKSALGIVLIVYSLLGIFRIEFQVRPAMDKWLAPIFGVTTGLIAAATGIFTVPGLMYVQGLGLKREDLIQALGLLFSISTFALTVNLFRDGVMHFSLLPISLTALAAAAAGMAIGTWLRLRTEPERFRLVFFFGMIALGAHLALHQYF